MSSSYLESVSYSLIGCTDAIQLSRECILQPNRMYRCHLAIYRVYDAALQDVQMPSSYLESVSCSLIGCTDAIQLYKEYILQPLQDDQMPSSYLESVSCSLIGCTDVIQLSRECILQSNGMYKCHLAIQRVCLAA